MFYSVQRYWKEGQWTSNRAESIVGPLCRVVLEYGF
jgi:hypothetical protein